MGGEVNLPFFQSSVLLPFVLGLNLSGVPFARKLIIVLGLAPFISQDFSYFLDQGSISSGSGVLCIWRRLCIWIGFLLLLNIQVSPWEYSCIVEEGTKDFSLFPSETSAYLDRFPLAIEYSGFSGIQVL